MTWRDRYQPGSFRGVPFNVSTAGSDHGRELAVHRFVKSETPFVEDLGRKARRFRLEAYVLGTDYFSARDDLIAALEAEGPGELVHPYRGTLQVLVLDFTCAEDTRDGGIATFSVACMELGTTAGLVVQPSAAAQASSVSSLFASKGEASSAGALVVTKVPPFVPKAAADQWQSVWKKFIEVHLTGPVEAVSHFRDLVAASGDKIVDQIADPYHWAHNTAELFRSIEGAAEGRYQAFQVYASFFGIKLPLVSGSSLNYLAAWNNSKAVVMLSRSQALAGASKAAALNTWETTEDALDAQAILLAELEDQAVLIDDDDVYTELGALRAMILSSVPPVGVTVPHLDVVVLSSSTSSLTLAQRLYADAARADEIALRNRVAHPGILPAEVPLEVLVDV